MQVTVGFLNGDGQWVAVQEGVNVLPTAGGGGAVSVESVNGQTGVVVLDAAAVGALADSYVPTWASITGKPATFAPTIGTTATTAKAGNYTPTWGDVTGKPAVIAAGADAAAARTAIGAGTSNLALGSTASTAAAGNHTHAASAVTATAIAPGTATNVQGILAELEARIAALESA